MIPVILSGGSGSRLWPVSRTSFPKQFCDLLDESLFAKTVKRLAPLGSPWVVTVKSMAALTEQSLRDLGVPVGQVIYEPFGKNTAPAVALLCHHFERLGFSNETVGVFPADHLVDDDAAFRKEVLKGVELSSQGEIVTLGIQPTYPATGYGYIATAGPLGGGLRATGFREKPNEETARSFLERGGFYWNAGMFIFRVSVMAELFKKFAPDIWQTISGVSDDFSNLDEAYTAVRSTSIDYAIMERLSSHACIPCSFGWNDLGSWDSLVTVLGHSSRTATITEVESKSNFVYTKTSRRYAFVGVEDLIVVDTPDALLITKKGDSELVKQVTDKLKV